jgi:hypothetical protein
MGANSTCRAWRFLSWFSPIRPAAVDTSSAARRARVAGLDAAKRIDTWDKSAAVPYDHTLCTVRCQRAVADGR